MELILTIDFGSTYTKLTAIDKKDKKILSISKSFTTIETDIREGLENGIAEIHNQIGKVEFSKILASSSAAGGLKMVSVGLVPDLTAKASKLAATSAGAKVIKTFSYELGLQDIEEIDEINPDIVLLCGGIDGGNKEVILNNAKMLKESTSNFSLIIAGNKSCALTIKKLFEKTNKQCVVCENVMPEFNKLNIAPAKKAIVDLFIKNIVFAKGLLEAQKLVCGNIIPTPLAVFESASLLSEGTSLNKGLGEILVMDLGGATTDVYSMANGTPTKPNTFLQGLSEPFAKRTVEGDIGMRYSLLAFLENIEINTFCSENIFSKTDVEQFVEKFSKNPELVASQNTLDKKIEEAIIIEAVRVSANRHCGFLERAFTSAGEVFLQNGKDLSNVSFVIGTGGAIANSVEPKKVLKSSCFSFRDSLILKPVNPQFMLDKKNIFAAMGLLSRECPETAISILKSELMEGAIV